MIVRTIFVIVVMLLLSACDKAPVRHRFVLVGTVKNVVDGDRLDIRLDTGLRRVRLHGIDAPELGQPHGDDSAAALAALVMNRRVELNVIIEDRFEGMIAIVFVNGTNANAALVKGGHAFAYRRFMRRVDNQLCVMEAKARNEKRGIWGRPKTEIFAPWEWRQREALDAFTDYSAGTAARCTAAIGQQK